jgi:beta-lactam-binding protein with PASTA domain
MINQEEKRSRSWKRVAIGLAVGVILVPVLVVAGFAVFRHENRKPIPAQTRVPSLKGLDLKTAETQARQARLVPQVLLRRWDIEAPVGTVVGQEPQEGESVTVDTMVGLEVCIEDPNKLFLENKKKQQLP